MASNCIGAADAGRDRAEYLVEFDGRENSPFRAAPSGEAAELRRARDGCAELDSREETKVRVGDAIEMFRRQSLVLPRFEKDMTEFSRGRPGFLVRAARIFSIGLRAIFCRALRRTPERRQNLAWPVTVPARK